MLVRLDFLARLNRPTSSQLIERPYVRVNRPRLHVEPSDRLDFTFR